MKEVFLSWYEGINPYKGKIYVAPHKPLTILFALVNLLRDIRWIEYNRDKAFLESLIQQNVNTTNKVNCLDLLWRLKNDNQEIEVSGVPQKNRRQFRLSALQFFIVHRT